MTRSDLMRRLGDLPSKPFRIHISDGTVLDLTQPGMVIVGETSAVLPTLFGTDADGYRYAKNWRTIALDHIAQFSDLPDSNGSKRRKRR